MGDARVITQTFTRAAFPDLEKVALTAERDVLRAEVEALQDRLEMRHAYDGSGNRIEVEPGSIPDGIACRDETIRQQDKLIDTLRAENARMREALQFYADGWQFVVEHDMHGYDRSRWHRSPAIDKDCGWTARDALGD